jgi:hypothetical protein
MPRNITCKPAGQCYVITTTSHAAKWQLLLLSVIHLMPDRARECDVAIKNAQCIAFICVSTAASFVSHSEQLLYQLHFYITTVANLDPEVRYDERDRMPAPCGIRTRDPNTPAGAALHLRPHVDWDRPSL